MNSRVLLVGGIAGIVLGLVLAIFGYRNDWILQQTYVASDLLPFSVYGFLILGLLVINPLLALISKRAALKGSQWGVIIALMLVAAVVPGPGLMWTFTNTFIMPYQFYETKPGWQKNKLLDYVPEQFLVGLKAEDPNVPLYERWRPPPDWVAGQVSEKARALESQYPGDANAPKREALLAEYAGNVQPPAMGQEPSRDYVELGKKYKAQVIQHFQNPMKRQEGTETRNISVRDVPWGAWIRPLSFWVPLVGLAFIASIALALLVHRQWAHRERLRYPIAEVVSELYQGSGDGYFARILHDPKFWMGFLPVLAILMLNGAQKWELIDIQIPLGLDLEASLKPKYPVLANQIPNAGLAFLHPSLLFAAVGFAYFLSSEVSFSLGISHILFAVWWFALIKGGVETSGKYFIEDGVQNSQLFGSYLGMGLIVVYIGRRFYSRVTLNAFGIPTRERAETQAIWAFRIAMVCALLIVLLLSGDWFAHHWFGGRSLPGTVNLHPVLACLFVILTGLLFLILTRINVETGAFFIQPNWWALTVLTGLFGVAALGPNQIVILAVASSILTLDPRVCLMPMAANALRFCENQNVRPAALSPLLMVMIILALVIGVGATVYWQYNDSGTAHGWLSAGAEYPLQNLLYNLGQYEKQVPNPGPKPYEGGFHLFQQTADGGLESIWRPSASFLRWAGLGLGVVLVCSFLRLRFQWWPLHPVLFLVWGTMPMARLAPSFLVGWVIKSAITRFGGGDAYRKYKPLFIGLIAGSLMAGILWQIAGVGYYLTYGKSAPVYRIHW